MTLIWGKEESSVEGTHDIDQRILLGTDNGWYVWWDT